MTACVIPCFRAATTVCDAVASALVFVDHVVVVDDGCPDGSGGIVEMRFATNRRVQVIRHPVNRGVGGAMKTGIARCLQLGATYVVKIDADGQMDASFIAHMLAALERHPTIAIVRGNRFADGSITRVMPRLRLLGNSVLTLLVRISTGYWNSADPTNGYFVIRCKSLKRIKLEALAERFYFEISLLSAFALRKTDIAEMEIPARYGDERSTLSIHRVALTFPAKLGTSFIRRVLWQYIISDMNAGSLFLVAGLILFLSGALLGGFWWIEALRSGVARTPGTVTLVLVPLIMGFQLLLNAVLYDVQTASRILKLQPHDGALYEEYANVAATGREPAASSRALQQ